jgi:hypothetical protein
LTDNAQTGHGGGTQRLGTVWAGACASVRLCHQPFGKADTTRGLARKVRHNNRNNNET